MERQTPTTDESLQHEEVYSPGSVVLDHYYIEDCLGVGNTTTVYKCHHKDFPDKTLVLKVLHSSVVDDDVTAARFQKEILASYELKHKNVIRSFEFIRKDNTLAYTMEYAGGGDLRLLLKQQSPLPIAEALKIARQICSGLVAIHAAGIVHRDLKPQNIFFGKEGAAKIADFGIARTKSGRKLTQQGEVLGAVDFVSPEYLQTGEVDHRSDIYAFGLIAYEMATGKTPFRGDTMMDSLMRRLKTDPEAPSSVREECPEALSQVVLRALQRDPDNRYQSAAEMLSDLENVEIAEEGTASPPVVTPSEPLTKRESVSETRKREPSLPPGSSFTRIAEVTPFDDLTPSKNRVWIIPLTTAIIVLGLGYFLFTLLSKDAETSKKPGLLVNQNISDTQDVGNPPANDNTVAGNEVKPDSATVTASVEGKKEEKVDSAAIDSKEPQKAPEVPAEPQAPNKEISIEQINAVLADPVDGQSTLTPPPTNQKTYTVKEGDTISGIARDHGVTPEKLMDVNNVTKPRALPVGKVLIIP